jgi:hypothetical protein
MLGREPGRVILAAVQHHDDPHRQRRSGDRGRQRRQTSLDRLLLIMSRNYYARSS